MNYAAIVQRITTHVTGLAKVAVSASLDGILSDTPVYPSAYLLAPNEKVGRNEGITHLMQRVEPHFSVAIRVNNLADMRGEAALAEVVTLRDQIRATLLNWQMDNNTGPIELIGARLLYAANGEAIWADEFANDYYLRAN